MRNFNLLFITGFFISLATTLDTSQLQWKESQEVLYTISTGRTYFYENLVEISVQIRLQCVILQVH